MNDCLSILIPDAETYDCVKAIRCLNSNIYCYLLSKQRMSPSFFSFYCHQHSLYEDDSLWLTSIENMILQNNIHVLFPILERAINLIICNKDRLSKIVRLPLLPSYDSMQVVSNKSLFHRFLLNNNLPAPPTIQINRNFHGVLNDYLNNHFSFPALLKPTKITGGGRGIRFCNTVEDLEKALNRTSLEDQNYMLQSYIPGTDLCLCAYCRDGKIIKYTLQQASYSKEGYFGPQRSMDFIENKDCLDLCENLIAALDWNGLICIDIRKDKRDGSLLLLEVNPRLGQAVLGSLSAGINFPLLACFDAAGISAPAMTYKPIRYHHPRESWRLLTFSNGQDKSVKIRSGLRYAIKDPLPEIILLVKKMDHMLRNSIISRFKRRIERITKKCDRSTSSDANKIFQITEYLLAKKADFNDVDFIIELNNMCLPDQRFWQGAGLRAKKWWNSLIDADFSEIWIFLDSNERVGFCKLDKDISRYENHKNQFRPTLLDRVYTIFSCPKISIVKFTRKFSKNYKKLYNQNITADSHFRFLCIRPIALSPKSQGKGLGGDALSFISKRAADLGFDGLTLSVDKTNPKAIRFYEKNNFIKTSESRYCFTFAKVLSCISNNTSVGCE